jgi:hypothetical protein
MLLGALMTELRNETTAAETLLSLGDIMLLNEIEAARLTHDESLGEYAAGAAQRFAHLASDEDWLKLMTALENSKSPAATCLATMVRWSLLRDAREVAPINAEAGCSCGAGGKTGHGNS